MLKLFFFFWHLLASFVTREEGIIQVEISVFSPLHTLSSSHLYQDLVDTVLKLTIIQLLVFRKAGQKFAAQSLVFLPSQFVLINQITTN